MVYTVFLRSYTRNWYNANYSFKGRTQRFVRNGDTAAQVRTYKTLFISVLLFATHNSPFSCNTSLQELLKLVYYQIQYVERDLQIFF